MEHRIFCGKPADSKEDLFPKAWEAFARTKRGFNGMLRLVRSKNKNKVSQKTLVPGHPTRLASPAGPALSIRSAR
jgi:hypothetical protein